MTIAQFLVVLRARWREFFAIVALAALAAVLLSVLLPRQYTATASLLVDVKTIEPITGAVLPPAQNSGYMATQIDLAQSERVLSRAARAIGLLDAPEFRFRELWKQATEGKGSLESWVLEQVGKKLEVRPTRESGVMTLAYTAQDPEAAARVVNAIMQSYIDTTLDLRLEPARQYTALFDVRAREVRGELEAAQAKLAEFQRQKGMVVSDERMDLESTRLAELSTQLVALQGVAAESGSRQRQADLNTERMPEVLANPVVSSLTQELSRQQARLSELNARLGEQHPQMVELKANVTQLRAQIERESRKVSGSVGVNNTVNQTRIAQLRGAIEEQRGKVLALRSARDEASVLLRDVQNAQRAYDAVLARASQSTLETQNRQTNVSVLKRATAPALASSPRLGLNLGIGLALGTIAALVFVMLRELADRRLRTVDDIENDLGLTFLVEIPAASRRSASAAARPTALGTAGDRFLPAPRLKGAPAMAVSTEFVKP